VNEWLMLTISFASYPLPPFNQHEDAKQQTP